MRSTKSAIPNPALCFSQEFLYVLHKGTTKLVAAAPFGFLFPVTFGQELCSDFPEFCLVYEKR